jgi:hypothetical protein
MDIFNALHESTKSVPALNEARADKPDLGSPYPVYQGSRPEADATPSAEKSSRYQNGQKGFRVTYTITTPESAARGECSDTGCFDEEGVSMDPDDGDEDLTAVDKAVKYLRDEGATQFQGRWWDSAYDTDYRTGAEETRSYHPYGFSEPEIDQINKELVRRDRIGR